MEGHSNAWEFPHPADFDISLYHFVSRFRVGFIDM